MPSDIGWIPGVVSDGEQTRLLEAWSDVAFAVVVDPRHSGAEPGTIRLFGPEEVSMPAPSQSLGRHALGIAHAVAIGRVLGKLSDRLVVWCRGP